MSYLLNHTVSEGWDIVYIDLIIIKALGVSAFLNWLYFLETAQVLILWQALLDFKETEVKN